MLVSAENRFDIDSNCKFIDKIANKVNKNVDILIFPEGMLTGYSTEKHIWIDEEDKRLDQLEDLSKRLNMGICIGAILKRNDKIYSAYICFLDQRTIYLKCHLGKRERATFEQGQELPIFKYKSFYMGIALCLESHIPDLIQNYRLRGVHMMIMPFASPKVCGNRLELWDKYLITRAYDNNIFICAVNARDAVFSGGAMVVGPSGESMARSEGLITTCHLSLDQVLKAQEQTSKRNYIHLRRPSLYERSLKCHL